MSFFQQGDALTLLRRRASNTIDLIYIDPPFGTTGQPWDECLPWSDLFVECFRLLKPTGNLIIHCSVPFNYTLIRSAPIPPSYSWYWKKNIKTGFLFSKKQPIRCMEEVLVWKMPKAVYYPQYTGLPKTLKGSKNRSNSYFESKVGDTEDRDVSGNTMTHMFDLPISLNGFSTRPTEIIDTIIKSYTAEGDTVLDFTCYKGISGVRCKALNRKWVGIDKYFLPELIMTQRPPPQPLPEILPPPEWNSPLVEVKPSLILNAGNGVFAKCKIKKGTCLGEYKGVEMTLKEFRKLYPTSQKYYYSLRCEKVLDGHPFVSQNISHYVNESASPNVILSRRKLRAAADIPEGQELYLTYPANYVRSW